MEEIALAQDWRLFGEMMHPLSTMDASLYTLDVEHFEDDVTHVMMVIMVGPTLALGHPSMMIWAI
jgi:hypothetical protein